MGLEVGQVLSGVIPTLMLTSLDLVLYTITYTDVAIFTITGKSFSTFWTLKRYMTSLVVRLGPCPLQNLSTVFAGVLLFVKVGLILVSDKLLMAEALLGAQVTVESLLLLNLKRVNIFILHNTLKFTNKLTSLTYLCQ